MTKAKIYAVFLAIILAGYGIWYLVTLPERRDFQSAKEANTITAYEIFLGWYPNGVYAAEAKDAIDKLNFQSYCTSAEGCDDFIRYYPKSPRKKEAEKRLDHFRWQEVQKLESRNASYSDRQDEYESLSIFTKLYPNSRHRKEAERRMAEIITQGGPSLKLVHLDPRPQGRFFFGLNDAKLDYFAPGRDHIHRMNADGTNDEEIARVESFDEDIILSPNGKWLAFPESVAKILITDLDGNFRGRITAEDYFWGSNSQLYFYSGFTGLYRYDPETNRTATLVDSKVRTLDHCLSISPSCKHIVYVHHEYGTRYWMRVLGGRLLEHGTSTHDEEFKIRWLSDTEIVVDDDRIINALTGEKRPVPDDYKLPILVSPDGQRGVDWYSSDSKEFTEISIPTGQETKHPFFFARQAIAFSPDSKDLAIVGDDGIYVYRFGVGTEKVYSKPEHGLFSGGIAWTK